MPKRIEEDWKDFRDIIEGKVREGLRKFIKNGQITRLRPDGKGKISYPLPSLEDHRIVHGNPREGVGRGPGKPGDIIGKDKNKDKGKVGEDHIDGIHVSVDMDDVIDFLGKELSLPNIKPKDNDTSEEVKLKYRKIAMTGPESLRHNKRTLIQAIKRQSTDGSLNELHEVPGLQDPVKLIKPINPDKRYRTYKEIKIPSSNALIIFARDGSGSMDDNKCEIVSDMAWWLEAWISRFYDKTEKMYVWHDTIAQEVDQSTFYNYRFGGGTKCSSAFEFAQEQIKNRYPPEKWNIYVFYFTDGENMDGDNSVVVDLIKNKFQNNVVNLTGVVQILAYNYDKSLKESIDIAIDDNFLDKKFVKTTSIGSEKTTTLFGAIWGGMGSPSPMSEEERGQQIIKAIKELLSPN
jgi:uncharacterized sporulation protein YeaH/YhbH (DUF444 family)